MRSGMLLLVLFLLMLTGCASETRVIKTQVPFQKPILEDTYSELQHKLDTVNIPSEYVVLGNQYWHDARSAPTVINFVKFEGNTSTIINRSGTSGYLQPPPLLDSECKNDTFPCGVSSMEEKIDHIRGTLSKMNEFGKDMITKFDWDRSTCYAITYSVSACFNNNDELVIVRIHAGTGGSRWSLAEPEMYDVEGILGKMHEAFEEGAEDAVQERIRWLSDDAKKLQAIRDMGKAIRFSEDVAEPELYKLLDDKNYRVVVDAILLLESITYSSDAFSKAEPHLITIFSSPDFTPEIERLPDVIDCGTIVDGEGDGVYECFFDAVGDCEQAKMKVKGISPNGEPFTDILAVYGPIHGCNVHKYSTIGNVFEFSTCGFGRSGVTHLRDCKNNLTAIKASQ